MSEQKIEMQLPGADDIVASDSGTIKISDFKSALSSEFNSSLSNDFNSDKNVKKTSRTSKKNVKTLKTRRHKRKKGWIFVLLLIAGAAGYFVYTNFFGGTETAPIVRYTEINRNDLISSISVKGNVQSVLKRNVYSTLNMTVKSVETKVGDAVESGQVLCYLDKEDLELNIEQMNAELRASIQSSEKQIETSEKTFKDAEENLRSGSNAQILSAESAVRNAKVSLDTAQSNYTNLLNDYNRGTGASRKSAESAVVSAQNDLDAKTRDLENNKLLFEAGAIAKETLTQSENLFENAQIRYSDALTNLENAKISEERALDQARNSLKSAETAHNNALAALDSARNAAMQELSRYENNVETARIGANNEARLISIKKLEKQLADSVIKSPVDGVVTAVYAKEGGSGAGLLFIIEDPDNLIVNIKVKEYDAGRIYPGMFVIIKSDAIPGVEYRGTLTRIDPAAAKNQMGETDTISDIEFGAEVSIDSVGTLLRIGMNTRLDIILEQHSQVYSVPYDSITQNEYNLSVVYEVVENDDFTVTAKEIPVVTGLETDFYVEISSPELKDGMRIINEVTDNDIYDGMAVALNSNVTRRGFALFGVGRNRSGGGGGGANAAPMRVR